MGPPRHSHGDPTLRCGGRGREDRFAWGEPGRFSEEVTCEQTLAGKSAFTRWMERTRHSGGKGHGTLRGLKCPACLDAPLSASVSPSVK